MKPGRDFCRVLAVGLAAFSLVAADGVPPSKAPPAPTAPATADRKTQPLDEAPASLVTPLRMHRVAPILGREANAASGERIGRLRDFAVELPSGRVGYAVVEREVSSESKLIAVPPAALAFRTNDASLLLSVDAARIRNAPGFDDAHWPSISSPAWGAGVLSRNPVQGTNEPPSAERIEQEGKAGALEKRDSGGAGERNPPVPLDRARPEASLEPLLPRAEPRVEKPDESEPPPAPNRPEKEPADAVTSPERVPPVPNVEQKADAPSPEAKAPEPPKPNPPQPEQPESGPSAPPASVKPDVPERLARASELIGATVKSVGGEKLGDVTDVVIDLNAGRIAFAVLSVGALVGGEEKLVAVPVEMLSATGERRVLRLDADKTLLSAGAGFNSQAWPDFSNESFAADVFRRFEAKPYWETGRSLPPANSATKGSP